MIHKEELIKRWRENNKEVTGLSNVKWNKLFSSMFDIIHQGTMVEGKDIRIPSFGVFKLKKIDQTERRNPKTGEALTIPAKTKLSFKSSKVLGAKKSATTGGDLGEEMVKVVEQVPVPPPAN